MQFRFRCYRDPNSLVTAALCCVISTVVGFLAAYAFLRGRLPFRGVFMSLMLLPLIVPGIVTAISIYFLSVRLGFIGSRICFTHAVVALPIVLILAQSVLQGIDPALERAAMVHGCTRWAASAPTTGRPQAPSR